MYICTCICLHKETWWCKSVTNADEGLDYPNTITVDISHSYLLVGEVALTGDSVDLQVECAAGFPIEDLNTEDVVVSSPATQSGTLFVCKRN